MALTRAREPREVSWSTMTRALETYRHSLDLYRQVLGTREKLARERQLVTTNGSVSHTNGRVHIMAAPDLGVPASAWLECLSPREQQVARLMARGFTNQQIAHELVVTRGTVANHAAHILAKLGLRNRTQVAAHVVAGRANGAGQDA